MQGSSLMLWSSKRGRAKRLLRCHAWSWDLQRQPAPLTQRQANTCLANQLLSCFRGGDQLAEGLQGSIWQTCEGEAELEGLGRCSPGCQGYPKEPNLYSPSKDWMVLLHCCSRSPGSAVGKKTAAGSPLAGGSSRKPTAVSRACQPGIPPTLFSTLC